MQKQYMIANFKMNFTSTETANYIQTFLEQPNIANRKKEAPQVVLCPPFTNLFIANQILKANHAPIALGAQNIHANLKGAFTGEISTNMARDVGATFVLLGHSERRTLFYENNETIASKMVAALSNHLTPVLCIGETLSQRNEGLVEYALYHQLNRSLDGISNQDATKIIVAYEPIWAIGTGVSANEEQIIEAAHIIKQILTKRFDSETANQISILYGGSLNASNRHFASLPGIHGGLVGGASLDPVVFATLCDF